MFKFRGLFVAGFVNESCYNKPFIQKPDKAAVFPGSQYIITFGIFLKIAVFEAFLNFFPAYFNPLFNIIDNL